MKHLAVDVFAVEVWLLIVPICSRPFFFYEVSASLSSALRALPGAGERPAARELHRRADARGRPALLRRARARARARAARPHQLLPGDVRGESAEQFAHSYHSDSAAAFTW